MLMTVTNVGDSLGTVVTSQWLKLDSAGKFLRPYGQHEEMHQVRLE
jgi:hypothetical protein